jgi:transposase
MGNLAPVKRDFKLLERRRLRAARLLSKGLSEAEVARRVGVHRQSVNRWNRQLADSSPATSRRAGRKSQLDPFDLRRVAAALESGPRASGYPTNGWTLRRVAELIEVLCGVRYTTVQAWRILRQLGWSWQRRLWCPPERGKAAPRQKKGRLRKLPKKTKNKGKP